MMRNLHKLKILWFLTALLALIASLAGALNPELYQQVVSKEIMPGVFSQDLMTILASFIVLFLTLRSREEDFIKQAVVLGILGFFFYGYGIYTIERLYNTLYILYMAIFSLSFYSIMYSLVNIRKEDLKRIMIPRIVQIVSIAFLLINPLIFYPLWISQLLPLIMAGDKVEFLYSIYILDLCFIMPAFIIVAVMTARKDNLGLFLTPALFVMGLLAPLALSEFLKPLFYDLPTDFTGMGLFPTLSTLFLIFTVAYSWNTWKAKNGSI
ncbi:MAG: hypothetical protein ACOC5L_00205 [Halobacteriota archaeon]